MATLLINEISAIPKDFILVLDEYHVLEAPSIIESLNFILKNLPPNLHLVIASRSCHKNLFISVLGLPLLMPGVWLDDVQQTIEAYARQEDKESRLTDSRDNLPQPSKGELALVRSVLAWITGDFQQATQHWTDAVTYLGEGNPFIRSMLSLEESTHSIFLGNTVKAIEALQKTAAVARRANNLFVLILTNCQLAKIQMLQGRLSQALVTLQKARLLAVGSDEEPLPLAGIIDNGLGEILRERNKLEEAKVYLERGRRLSQFVWSPSRLEAVVSLARLLQSRGDIAESQRLIEEALRLSLSAESSQWDEVSIAATAVMLVLQRGDLPTAHRLWEPRRLSDFDHNRVLESYPYHVLEYLLLTQARYYLAIAQIGNETVPMHQALELLQLSLPKAVQFK